nr:MAG TPA_asm: hypothetical protein [Caudoviricetes sp.]
MVVLCFVVYVTIIRHLYNNVNTFFVVFMTFCCLCDFFILIFAF